MKDTYVFTTSNGNTGIQERQPAAAPHTNGERLGPRVTPTALVISNEYTTKYNPYPGISLAKVASKPLINSPFNPSCLITLIAQSISDLYNPFLSDCINILILSIGFTRKLVTKPKKDNQRKITFLIYGSLIFVYMLDMVQ